MEESLDSKTGGKHRVTIREIAAEAGVHFTTVGLALRKSPQLATATGERIRKIAKVMGYQPDPVLGALSAYRRKRGPRPKRATLAWINNWPVRESMYKISVFQEYFDGAGARAAELGYGLEEFWLYDKGMTASRMGEILRARGIEGILLAPQPRVGARPPLAYEHFAVVCFGYTLQPYDFHLVTNHHFHSMNLILEHLVVRGYRRIGLFVAAESDQKVENSWHGGLALALRRIPGLEEIPPLFQPILAEQELSHWLQDYHPDVVVSQSEALSILRKLGYHVPQQVGFVSLSVESQSSSISGIFQNSPHIGAAAVDMLNTLLHNRERGIPPTPTRLLVESSWREGTTLRPIPVPSPDGAPA